MTRPANPELPGKILDTAEHIVASEGHAALSMRRLAAAGGVTPTTLYYYFDSKDHILGLLKLRTAKRLNGKLQRLGSADAGSVLAEVAEAYVAFAEANPRLFELLVEPLPGASALSPEERRTLHFPYFAAERIVGSSAEPISGPPKERVIGPSTERAAADGQARAEAVKRWILLHGFVSLLASGALESILDLHREELKAMFLEIFAEPTGSEGTRRAK